MQISLAYSTCPNDTFIFDAIANNRIDCEGLEFDIHMADVEELNLAAFSNKFAISKLSYHAYAYIQDKYQICNSGSALGRGNGPLFISKRSISNKEITDAKIAIPGKYTTANFLFSIAYPQAINKKAVLFSDIESLINKNTFDAGVIIHENRFTYSERGFTKILDLGEYWEEKTQAPIPLGGIAIDRNLPDNIKKIFNRVLQRSLVYAFEHPEDSLNYIKQHAQEMEDDIIQKHIKLFVNKFSINLKKEGKNAIYTMLNEAKNAGLISTVRDDIFIE